MANLEQQEGRYNVDEVLVNAEESLDFLCALAMPHIYEYAFPPKYLDLWSGLKDYIHRVRDFSQLAVGLPRGFSKTTLFKLFCLYVILFTKRNFILVICANEDKAVDFITDVMNMLREPNIKSVFGDYTIGIETSTKQKHVFTFRGRKIILKALGSNGDPRGINVDHQRPDVMIFDDMQSKELAESQLLSEALERWLVGTVMKAKSPRGCLYIFIANMYPKPYHSILRKLKDNPNWVKFIVGGILADGSSLWEELQPLEQLVREYENDLAAGHPEIFYAEVLNDETASVNNLIDLSKLPPVPIRQGEIPAGNFVIIDPASGKVNSDDIAIGYFEVYDSFPVMMEVHAGKYSPGETIKIALQLCLKRNCRLVCIEAVAYQSTLAYWFDFICVQMGITGIDAMEIFPGGNSKNSRILTMFKAYSAGEIFIHDSAKALAHTEIRQFNPLRRDNTDNILDLLTYAPKVMLQFPDLIMSNNVIQQQDYQALEVISEYDNCCF